MVKKKLKRILCLHECKLEKYLNIKYHQPSREEIIAFKELLIEKYFSKFPPPSPLILKKKFKMGIYGWKTISMDV